MPPTDNTSPSEDHAEAVGCLRGFIDRIESLSAMVSAEAMSRDDREEARRLLAELKEDLRAELHRLEGARRAGLLTAVHAAFTLPALRECSAKLKIGAGSRPGAAWTSGLYSARLELLHRVDQLEATGSA